MATKTENKAKGRIFLWKIENISHSWLKKREKIASPYFIADAHEGTKWSLWLYPMGVSDENNVGFYLLREKDCSGPDIIEVDFQLAFLGKDGSIVKERTVPRHSFWKGKSWGFSDYEARKDVFATERETFLPEDTLTAQCSIWCTEQASDTPKLSSARTVFKVNRRSFVWKIEEFSALKPGVRNKFKDDLIEFYLVLNERIDFVKKLDINIISFKKSIKNFSFKTSIINSDGENDDFGTHEYFAGNIKKGVLSTLFFFKKLIENKSRYLSHDILMLDCEYVSSNGTFFHELCSFGIIFPKISKINDEKTIENCVEKDKYLNNSFLANDLKSMYNEGICSDTELRTSTRTFPAHKNILSARSPVFRKMFSYDMKENNSGNVDIVDLEDDTVHRMLLYLYTDRVEDVYILQQENASKLYEAADKYGILSLRNICSSFLKTSLSPIKAFDVLILADRHQDDDLKCAVQNFILRHGTEVFGTLEWKNFMDTNIQLAADIMYRKLFPG